VEEKNRTIIMLINWFFYCCPDDDKRNLISAFRFIVSPLTFFMQQQRTLTNWLLIGRESLTFSGPRWRDLWQRIDAVDPAFCRAFRDNTPNDLVYPMPISSRPDVWVSEERQEREKERCRYIKNPPFI
jgi:hypothetical protein